MRLLASLGADGETGTRSGVSKEIRFRASNIHELEATITKAQAQEPGSNWKKRWDQRVQIWCNCDNQAGSCEVLGDVDLDCEPLHLCVLREFDLATNWSLASDIQSLAMFSESSELYRLYVPALISILSDSILYMGRNYVDVLDERGYLAVIIESPALDATSYRGIDIPPSPKGVQRVKQIGRLMLRPVSNNKSCFTVCTTLETP